MMLTHLVNVSGGKDSTACYLLALERGRPFRAIMADTGHEHPATMEYAAALGARTGGPQVEFVAADFSDRIRRKRVVVETKWRAEGIPETWIERARAVLEPTGNPFLDLCIWKGRFPSRRAQFCTEFLKTDAIWRAVLEPALARGPVVQWLGVRRDESPARRNVPRLSRVRTPGMPVLAYFRPLVDWTAEQCFALHAHHGLEPNPLYREGMGRVGCFPCINASKGELAQIALRYPDAFARIAEWERIVAEASKRGASTFFHSGVTPEGRAMARQGISGGRDGPSYPGALEVARWALTDIGGRQTSWILDLEREEGLACSSQYGLCE